MSTTVGLRGMSPSIDSQQQQFVSVTQSPRWTEAVAVMFSRISRDKNQQKHIPLHVYFHCSSSYRSSVYIVQFCSVFSAATHSGCLSLAWVKSRKKKKSLRPVNVPAHTQLCLFQQGMNNSSVIILCSLHFCRTQNPSIFSIFSVLFLSLLLLCCLLCQPTITPVLGHSCGEVKVMISTKLSLKFYVLAAYVRGLADFFCCCLDCVIERWWGKTVALVQCWFSKHISCTLTHFLNI